MATLEELKDAMMKARDAWYAALEDYEKASNLYYDALRAEEKHDDA